MSQVSRRSSPQLRAKTPLVQGGFAADEIGRLLADHDRGRVSVAAGYRRHDGGIGDAQSFNAIDAQLRVDDAHGIDAHFTGAGLVVIGFTGLAYPLDAVGTCLRFGPERAFSPSGKN